MANIILSYWYRLYTRQTPAEEAFEHIISRFGIRYRTQHIVMSVPCVLDFYLPDYNLAIEIDDPSHNEPKKIKKDQKRTLALSGLGIEVLRFTNAQVLGTPMEVLKMVRKRLDEMSLLSPKTPTTPTPPESTPPQKKKRGRPRKVAV